MSEDYALFAHVVEAGSLTAAGRILRLSPAMVSKRLARLEARLGARLIHRTTRRLSTTPIGQAFYDEAVAILAAIAEAEARVAGQAAAPSGRLAVSAPTSFGRMHIAPHLAGFLARHPQVEIELNLTDAFVDLLAERTDMAIRITPPPTGGYGARLLAPNRRILCAAPAYIEAHGAPADVAALAGHRLLAATGQSPWRLEGPGGIETVAVASQVRTNSSEVVRELALAGQGVALRSAWDVNTDLREGRLQRVLADWRGADDVGIYAVYPRSTLVSANVRSFVDYLAGVYRPVAPWEEGG